MMSESAEGHAGLFAATLAGVVLVDQVTKIWAVDQLATRDIDVVWRLQFNLARNSGASFSLGPGLGPLIGVIASFVTVVLFVIAMRYRSRRIVAVIGIVAGGVVGNVVDRVFRADDGPLSGDVIDFIDFENLWPIFNVADSAIVCGVAVLFVLLSRHELDADQGPGRRPLFSSGPAAPSQALLDRFDADAVGGKASGR